MSLFRKVIHIGADDSPNVQVGKLLAQAGIKPPYPVLIPGVVTYEDFLRRSAKWDERQRCIRLIGKFYEGEDVQLYPENWLQYSFRRALEISTRGRNAKSIGCDPAEGGDNTCWSVVDELGLIELESKSTPDTTVVSDTTIELMKVHNVSASDVYFDRGGGGKQHADYLRRRGYKVITVGFGEGASNPNMLRRMRKLSEKIEDKEIGYAFKNRRAEMAWLLREQMDPVFNEGGFAIPERYSELIRQMRPIPVQWDREDRFYLPPKRSITQNSTEITLIDLIGCSPDEWDSLMLAVYGMLRKRLRIKVGSLV